MNKSFYNSNNTKKLIIRNNYFESTKFKDFDELSFLLNEYFNNNIINNVLVCKIIPRGRRNNYIKVYQTNEDEGFDCMILCDKEYSNYIKKRIIDIYSNNYKKVLN